MLRKPILTVPKYLRSLSNIKGQHVTVDLRSDTLTLPSDEMRNAMAKAKVGDDIYDGDPSVKSKLC